MESRYNDKGKCDSFKVNVNNLVEKENMLKLGAQEPILEITVLKICKKMVNSSTSKELHLDKRREVKL